MLKRSIFAVSILAFCAAAPAQAAKSYSAIYSFGDSLSDVGNLFLATGAPASPYVDGQFSNGPVWNQDLATLLGLTPLAPSSLPGGTDYAWGGATTGFGPTDNPSAPVPTLLTQVGSAKLANPSSALFTFSIGANDLLEILGSGATPSDMESAAAGAALVVAQAAGTLESEGARSLALFDVPDLGVTPEIALLHPTLITAASALSAYFDQQVLADLKKYASGLTVYNINTYELIDAAPGNPVFTNTTQPCLSNGVVCATPDSYLFWDDLHPTATAHGIIAAQAFAQVTGVPEPASWALALIGFAGLGFAARRRSARAPGQ